MYKSKDGTLEIYLGATPSDVIYGPAAWSVVNIPADAKEAATLFKNLYDVAHSRHVILGLCRHKRKQRVEAVKNLPSDNWSYLETVSIFYERPSTCSNNGFLPISETGWILYKGDTPDAKKTEWFSSGEYNNATNLWNVAPQPAEDVKFSYYQKFNWETQLLLMNLAEPVETNRFIYTLPLDKNEQLSLFAFCRKYRLTACLYVDSHDEATEILRNYYAVKEKLNEQY